MTHPKSFEELMAERSKTLDMIRATNDRISDLIDLITAQIQLEQQGSNTNADPRPATRAEMSEDERQALRIIAHELRRTNQELLASSQELIARNKELRDQSQRIQASKPDMTSAMKQP